MLVGDFPAPGDHRLDIFGGARVGLLLDIEPGQIRLEIGLIELGDIPGGLARLRRHLLHLVLARIGVGGQVADIGDVDHVSQPVALELQRPPQRIGKDIGPHVADVLVVVDRRPARIDPRLMRVDGLEGLQLAGQAVEQAKVGHGPRPYPGLRCGQLPPACGRGTAQNPSQRTASSMLTRGTGKVLTGAARSPQPIATPQKKM